MPSDAFDTAWALMKSIDDDSNDDEFIDNDRFNNPVARGVKEILGIFGLDDNLECFGCGFTGDTGDFTGWHGGRGRKCPNCNSYSVHDPEGPAVGDNYKHKDETPEEETARRNEYYDKIHRENEERKKPEGGQ
tara:strand:- start:178 stop:576 length:399 start_codon:yes stop_codon:yes gene_type:complete